MAYKIIIDHCPPAICDTAEEAVELIDLWRLRFSRETRRERKNRKARAWYEARKAKRVARHLAEFESEAKT